ncbi:MAG: malonic semialdehyde reductase [Lysobacter sp.]|jgi:3-hydroxypropanoate dehydrogenase|uniref:Putative NADH dehydrogenase/NAD(P)H nitroreductase SNE33_08465 n=2 Tax=Lysobacteraceae TaxID=32033 RepID=A0ABU7YQS4_9GAMM|nr:malonic semialdehyde reductase [Lysobacter luteus]MDV3255921.1 malonic semialdehyde reductase [Lysobacter sp.]MDV5981918.1 malonic semialdehyde reductase [Lysobacter sp.]CAG4969582.1 putative malonic semialdehyde reductase RutE [Lysobacter luteus]
MPSTPHAPGHALDDASLDQLFRTARTHNELGGEVSDETLRALYDLLKWGPTSANMGPARLVFVKSPEAKARLAPALDEGNRAKTMAAPVTVIVGHDEDFHEKLPYLFPHTDAKSWFEGPREGRSVAAFRNGSLQGAYLILAARALGLDTGPMSGFNNAMVDELFFAGTAIKSNFLVNLGHGDPARLFPRSPRLAFDEAARIV